MPMAEEDERSTGAEPQPQPPSPILRRVPSQRMYSRSPTFARLPRRQSTHERINEILEAGIERAGSMHSPSWSSARSPGSQPLASPAQPLTSPRGMDEDGAAESTGLMMRANSRNYLGAQTATPRRSPVRRPQSVVAAGGDREVNGDINHEEEEEGEEEGGAPAAAEEEKHSWREYFSGVWSIELENKGSVARDHLALERTFLAWLRTSLAFASIGIAITQLFRLNTRLSDGDDPAFRTLRHLGKPLGATFLAVSILVLLLGYQRYSESQQWVMKGKFPASRGTVILVSLIAFALMAVSLMVVVVVQPAGAGE